MKEKQESPIVRLLLIVLGTVFFVKLAVFFTELHMGSTSEFPRSTMELFANLAAAPPYKWRILVPYIVHVLHHSYGLNYYLCFYYIEVICWLVLFACAHQALTRLRLAVDRPLLVLLSTTVAIPLSFTLVTPLVYFQTGTNRLDTVLQYYVPYDIPSAMLVFAAYLLLLMLRERYSNNTLALYLFVYVVSSINRETTVLFAFLSYAVLRGRVSKGAGLCLLFGQVAIFALFRGGIYYALTGFIPFMGGEPSSPYDFMLWVNVNRLTMDAYFKKTLFSYACGGILLYLPFGWSKLSAFNRQAFWLYCAPVLVMGLVFGVLPETRIFTELMPLAWIFLIQVIAAKRNGASVKV
jgi:hypothetical protein